MEETHTAGQRPPVFWDVNETILWLRDETQDIPTDPGASTAIVGKVGNGKANLLYALAVQHEHAEVTSLKQ